MSYYRELKDFILELKGGEFFLSPRDRWFLKFLEESSYPLEVVKQGIKKFFLFYPPEKRSKLPLFMSYREIEKLNEYHRKNVKPKVDWHTKFKERLSMAESIIKEPIAQPEVKDIWEAEEFLRQLENKIAKKLWDGLSKEEKKKIRNKFQVFEKDDELFKSMIKRELFKQMGLKGLSLFLD
ncbi:MAG: hypothetical protein NZ526_00550 [Aquificaceae bacterium]|nr:hypothetical protein [Aquificaceae bacterium]